MLSLVFEEKKYFRYNNKWVDCNDMVVHLALQDKLNQRYAEIVDLSAFDVKSLIEEADRFKKSESYILAIRYYEEAVKKCDSRTVSSLFPRLSSCYRKCGMAKKSIDLLSEAKKKHGMKIVTSELLVSAAAAYCDLEEYDNAKKCADRANAISNNSHNEYLTAVYRRIKSEKEKNRED